MSNTIIECNRTLISKKALSLFNIHLTLEQLGGFELTEDGGFLDNSLLSSKHEAYLCNTWIDSAYDRVLNSFYWSFLTKPLVLERVSKEENFGFLFAFQIQDIQDEDDYNTSAQKLMQISNLYAVNDRRFKVSYKKIKDIIYTNSTNIKADGIYKRRLEIIQKHNYPNPLLFSDCYPSEFLDLIAYQLALLIAPSIAPKDLQIQQLIASQYNLAKESLLKQECNSIRRLSNEEVE